VTIGDEALSKVPLSFSVEVLNDLSCFVDPSLSQHLKFIFYILTLV
jgi:hypothetical protein